MLSAEASEIASALSRICVLRTEDYHLLREIQRNPRQAGVDRHYRVLVAQEFSRREQWRQCRETILLQKLQVYEEAVMNHHRHTEAEVWQQLGSFQSVYAETVQRAYGLQLSDLDDSPFARMKGSRCLYQLTASSTPRESPLPMNLVHRTFFGAQGGSGQHATRLVDILYPIRSAAQPANTSATAVPDVSIKQESRDRLRSSRHVWCCLLLLWIHGLRTATAARTPAAALDTVAHIPSQAAEEFMGAQRGQLERMLRLVEERIGGAGLDEEPVG